METVASSANRLTPMDIERRLVGYSWDRRLVRTVVKDLVARQELMYVNDHGHTFVTPSFQRPVRIGRSIILKPRACKVESRVGDTVVSLVGGPSFGNGHHPTTRLCLQGLEQLLSKKAVFPFPANLRALDVGTGTGVLIIAAVKMGVGWGVGLDIDAWAVSEARCNVDANGVSDRIVISAQPFEEFEVHFDLILANLRTPSLMTFLPDLLKLAAPGGEMLVSGIKSAECDRFGRYCGRFGLMQTWKGEDQGWVALTLSREERARQA